MYRLWLHCIDLDTKSIEKKNIEFFCRKKLEANNTPFKNELNNKKILWQSVYHKIFLEEELVCRIILLNEQICNRFQESDNTSVGYKEKNAK